MSQLWSGSHIRRANSVSTPGSHRTLEPGGWGGGFKQALTPWLRLRGRVKGGCGVPVLRRDLTPFIWDGTFWLVAYCGKRIRSQRNAGGCESHTFALETKIINLCPFVTAVVIYNPTCSPCLRGKLCHETPGDLVSQTCVRNNEKKKKD